MEVVEDRVRVACSNPFEIDRHVDLVGLADVADVARMGERVLPRAEFTVCFDLAARLLAERVESRGERYRERGLVSAMELASRVVETHVGGQQPERRERSRMRGDDHRRDRQSPGELGGVQRTCATEGDERVIARIVAPRSQGNPHGAFHGGVDHLDRAGRRVLDARAEAPPRVARSPRARARHRARGGSRAGSPRSADRESAGSP